MAITGVTALSGIGCSSQTTCISVGTTSTSYAAILTTSTGASWTSVATGLPTGTTALNQISCPSTSTCYVTATVSGSQALLSLTTTNSWSTWTWAVVTGAPGWIANSISCPSTTECYLTGTSSGAGVVTQYSSGTWTSQTISGTTTSLSGISCVTTTQCVAVGTASSTQAVAVTDDSTNGWVAHAISTATNLTSVNCPGWPGATDCYAMGQNSSSPAIEHITFASPTWSFASESVPYGVTSLSSVGCGSSSACVAVGQTSANAAQILSTTNSGSTWQDQTIVTLYTYDADGHQLSMQDGQGTAGITTYNYDPLGRLTSQVDDFSVTTSYGYDLVNNKTSITYPGAGHTVVRTFDGANQLTSVTTWLSHPADACHVASYPDTTNFAYDLDGNLTLTTLPTCDGTSVSADTISQGINQDNTEATVNGTWSGTAYSIAYTRNGLGYVNSRTVSPAGVVTNYGYDAMGRVTTSNTQTFQYDAANNLTCNQSGQYQTYNTKGELNINYQTCGSTATVQDNFTYDAYGDRTEELVPWGTGQVPLYYEYVNSVGEMTGYTAFFTQTNYSYSGNGQLLTISQGSTSLAQMTWDEAASTPKILSDNTWDFIYGPGGKVFEAIKAGTPVYLINDAVGSPLGNLSTNGTVNNGHIFNTWGDSPASGAPPIGFDNAYYDGASTFYYLMNRWYDPNEGQFMTEDPRILATGQPWGYAGVASLGAGGVSTTTPMGIDQTQIYQFGNDNPVSVRDMTGLCGEPCVNGVNAEVGIGAAGGAVSSPFAAVGYFEIAAFGTETEAFGLLALMGPFGAVADIALMGLAVATVLAVSTTLANAAYKGICGSS